MAENLNYNMFPLNNEVNTNDAYREGALILEYFQQVATIASLEETMEVPTNLDEVLGVIDLKYNSSGAADPTDTIQLHTDGVITTGAVTVNVTCLDIANGDITVRGFLVGRRKMSSI